VKRKRKIEVFSGGSTLCKAAEKMVSHLESDTCEIRILDIRDPNVADRAKSIGVRSVPAIILDGRLIEYAVDGSE
jgi:glutaredoxin 3